MRTRLVVTTVLLLILHHAAANADVVQVTNGDRINGSVSRLERGRLAFATDAAGTISIAWAEVVTLTSTRTFDVELAGGARHSGSIASPSDGRLTVQTASGATPPIEMKEIIRITPIADGFRARMSGSVDFGMNFTTASDTRNYTLNANALHYNPSYETEATFESLLANQADGDKVTRNDGALDVRRRLAWHWYALAFVQAQEDNELDLNLRLVAGGGVGRRLVQSNAALLAVEGGLDYDSEWYESEDDTDHSVEAFGRVNWDWFGHSLTEEIGRAHV